MGVIMLPSQVRHMALPFCCVIDKDHQPRQSITFGRVLCSLVSVHTPKPPKTVHEQSRVQAV